MTRPRSPDGKLPTSEEARQRVRTSIAIEGQVYRRASETGDEGDCDEYTRACLATDTALDQYAAAVRAEERERVEVEMTELLAPRVLAAIRAAAAQGYAGDAVHAALAALRGETGT
jgi:hypothetical protein